MITFYKHSTDCIKCFETETALKDMVVAHSIKLLPAKSKSPFIMEGNKKFSGHQEIETYIKELEETVSLWRKFQSDSCYVDSDGKVC